MKNQIGRTLFWFRNGENDLSYLDYKFFSVGLLLNRFLNETYKGKTKEFINIYLCTEETYRLYPKVAKYHLHSTGSIINYYDVFDLYNFNSLDFENQKQFLWRRGYEILQLAAKESKNPALLEACNYAYEKGLKIGLNPDFKLLETKVILHDTEVNACLWIKFYDKLDLMKAIFTLEKNEVTVFEKLIDEATIGIEFFLEIYKKIEAKGNSIIIKGHHEIDYLPMKIPISADTINKSL